MRYHNSFTDDSGQKWEFLYVPDSTYLIPDGGTIADAVCKTVVKGLRYRKAREATDPPSRRPWFELPPWATVRDDWKITLGFFDEDEETGEMTFWPIEAS